MFYGIYSINFLFDPPMHKPALIVLLRCHGYVNRFIDNVYIYIYIYIVQKFEIVENFDEFDKWLVIRQSFPYKTLSLLCEIHDQFIKVLLIKLL